MAKNAESKISKPQSLRVLIVEDSQDDALLIIRELKKGGYNPVCERIETAAAMKKALQEKQWDIILCDYKLPRFNAPSALAVLKETSIDIPIIIASGTIGEETAVECMRLGAQDYIMKNNLSRLCPAIKRELQVAESRSKRKQAESQREAALEALRQSEDKYRSIIENMQEGYFELDLAGNFTFVNDATCRLMGYSREELIGKNNRQYTDEETAKKTYQAFNRIYRTGEPIKGIEETYIRKDGIKGFAELSVSLLGDAEGKPIGFWGISHDITERKHAEEELKHLSTHDALTGLYNRGYFVEEMARLERGRQFPVSIVSADLDHLKETNDHHGHAAGDALIKRVAQVLTAAFRAEDVVARVGGDEFAVLLPGTDATTAEGSLRGVRQIIQENNAAHPKTPLCLSLGVSTAEKPAPLADVLKKADANMYHEKRERNAA